MRPRSKAVALSISLVMAASSGATTAGASSSPRNVRPASAPATAQSNAQMVAEDDDSETAADQGN